MRKRYTTQNLYKTNLTNPVNGIDDIGNTDDVFTITVDETPLSTLSEGFLVIDFNIPDKRDFIKYHDVTGNVFSYYRKDRDLLNNGSKSIRHNAGAYVQINVVKEFTEHLFNNVDDFGYIEDFGNDDIKVYGGYVDTPTGPTLIADARLNGLSNGTRYIFFDYADNTFKKLSSTSGYIGFQVATIVVSSGDITSITDTRTLDLPVRYDPTVFDFGADGELKLVGSPSISDATTATKGRVRLGDLTDHENATAGPVVVTTENLVKTSTGATDENKVPILDEYGYIDWSMIPTIILANATDSGTDTYVTTADPPLSEYVTGQLFTVTFAETNTTTTPTLNIDGLGAVQIRDKNSVDLAVGDLTTNKMILMKVGSSFKVMQELPATEIRQGIAKVATLGTVSQGTSLTDYLTPYNVYALGLFGTGGSSFSYGGETITVSSSSENTGLAYDLGRTASTSYVGQSFTISTSTGTLSSISLSLRKHGSPAGNLTLKIYSDTGTTLLYTSTNTISTSSLTASFADYVFSFTTGNITAGTYYYRLESSVLALNGVDYVRIANSFISNSYVGGVSYQINGSNVWSTNSGDHVFTVTVSPYSYGGDVTFLVNYTLTADLHCDNLTINNGVTLNTGGYRIFVKGTLTNNGTIARNGNNGSVGSNGSGRNTGNGGAAGAALATGTIFGSYAGGTGGGISGNPSSGGNATNVGNSQSGSNGGGGGNAAELGGGSYTGGTGGTTTLEKSLIRSAFNVTGFTADSTEQILSTEIQYLYGVTTGFTLAGSGSGGGGESGTTTNGGNVRGGGGGGGGGSAGGIVYIAAASIVNNGTISANGGNGGNGGQGYNIATNEARGGCGGGGGAGGLIICIYGTKSGAGTYTVTAGTGGTGGVTTNTVSGYTGANGAAGTAGKILYLKV